jgi:hypothetical protein
MINNETIQYLSKWPKLKIEDNKIFGTVEFVMSYNQASNKLSFVNEESTELSAQDIILYNCFDISISQSTIFSYSKLPLLKVEGVESIPDRHIHKGTDIACLCSPLEEDNFLYPEFNFQKYFEELVLPFLYAQKYYSINNEWPWFGYMHGNTGILESYGIISDPNKLKQCIDTLKRDPKSWTILRSYLLNSKSSLKGHNTYCTCLSGKIIRKCHLKSLDGLNKLKRDIRNSNSKNLIEE